MAAPQWRADENTAFQPGHRTVPSLTTQASAIADSTITFGSIASGSNETPLRFSHFPMPPSTLPDVPGTPLGRSPVASTFTVTPPTTPGRTHPAAFPSQDNPQHHPRLLPTAPLQMRQKPFNAPEHLDPHAHLAPPPAYQAEAPPMPAVVRQAYRKEAAYIRPSSPSSGSLSPYDWHDGSSSFVPLDGNEDRLLSTSFITSLLASTDTHGTSTEGSARGTRVAYGGHALRPSEGTSLISEMTYPPPRTTHTPVLEHQPGAPPMPTSYIPVPGARWMVPDHLSDADTDPSGDTHAYAGVLHAAQASVDGESRAPSESSSSPLRPEAWGSDGAPVASGSQAYPPAGRSPGSSQRAFRKGHAPRQSFHSTRTTRSHMSSLIDRVSATARSLRPLRRKPLPPVPTLPHLSPAQAAAHRREEDRMPLPDLVERAGALSQMLERGQYPAGSVSNQNLAENDAMMRDSGAWNSSVDPRIRQSTLDPRRSARPGNGKGQNEGAAGPKSPRFHHQLTKKKKIWIFVGIAVVVLAVALGVGLALALRKKGDPVNKCSSGLAGASCNLVATCVCTSTSSSQCTKLSQNLVDLTPSVNALFASNFTIAAVATALWQAQGDPVGNDCASQAALIDVAPALDAVQSPNRTAWAQAAVLWTLVNSQNVTATAQMRKFVARAPWTSASAVDGPFPGTGFVTRVLGYDFDFAAQRVVEPSVSFVDDGEPSNEQSSRVANSALTALDRMYTFASAAGIQRATALTNYWTQVLQQQASDLPKFMSTVSLSPVLLPFDATATFANNPVAQLLTNSSTTPFPPPLACYPGLDSSTMRAVTDIEAGIFGLTSPSAASQFDQSCYASRPIYGVLDILRLRLPFIDSRTGTAKQAAVLQRDAGPRAVLYAGEVLSAMPAASGASNSTSTVTDPRQFGTLNHLSHVMLDYLSSIDDTNLAISLVEYVLTAPTVPPSNTSALFRGLAQLPTLEVAVFGTVLPTDLASIASSFATPNGSLFFGSDASAAVRTWAINAAGAPVVWADSAGAPKVVREASLDDDTFALVWDPAFQFQHTQTTGVVVNVGNITTAFSSVGLMVA